MITRGDDAAGALFSDDLTMRYRLWRRWADGPVLVVIGLNPSTADEAKTDPTVAKCMRHAIMWGLKGLVMLNLFPYRSTDPVTMKKAVNQLPRWLWRNEIALNRDTIWKECYDTTGSGGAILAAWGNHGSFRGESHRIMEPIKPYHDIACLGLTKSGEPRHPLYVPMLTKPVPFSGTGGWLCC